VIAVPSEIDVKKANIRVYEATIKEYDAVGIHADQPTEMRWLCATDSVGADRRGWHLDVGCGPGYILRIQAKTGVVGMQIGLDISLAALRTVRKYGFYAVLGDAEKLPLRSNAFIRVTASSVLHHLFTPERILQEEGVLITDFDPSAWAAQHWSWLALRLYDSRIYIYRRLHRIMFRNKVGHINAQVQNWNQLAEYHNHPGAGFHTAVITQQLKDVGFHVLRVLTHCGSDTELSSSRFVRPSFRHIISQTLSGRNPFLRSNADVIMTISMKPNCGGPQSSHT
jgi:ubiquinone/menaquinone biosynthesis C-methylase UbiE